MDADDRWPLCTPFDIMKGKAIGRNEILKHWFRLHTLLLLVLEIRAIYAWLRLSMGRLLQIFVAVNASEHVLYVWRHHAITRL